MLLLLAKMWFQIFLTHSLWFTHTSVNTHKHTHSINCMCNKCTLQSRLVCFLKVTFLNWGMRPYHRPPRCVCLHWHSRVTTQFSATQSIQQYLLHKSSTTARIVPYTPGDLSWPLTLCVRFLRADRLSTQAKVCSKNPAV